MVRGPKGPGPRGGAQWCQVLSLVTRVLSGQWESPGTSRSDLGTERTCARSLSRVQAHSGSGQWTQFTFPALALSGRTSDQPCPSPCLPKSSGFCGARASPRRSGERPCAEPSVASVSCCSARLRGTPVLPLHPAWPPWPTAAPLGLCPVPGYRPGSSLPHRL